MLFDNVIVRGNAIRFINREAGAQGAGWTIANSVIWNAEATEVEVHVPPGAYNLAYGCRGTEIGNGIVSDPRATTNRDFHRGSPIQPRSLFLAQLVGAPRASGRAAARQAPRPAVRRPSARELTASDVRADEAPAARLRPTCGSKAAGS